ncbi:MAG: sigma-54-dependent Fis family transcriptional regulator [Chitinophagaceae bacterium]|nr:MAG: sigma-54-dependent Fis family transcriptional regulator [Chitinophagaceae bacterium]
MDIQSVKQRFGIIGNNPALNNALSTAIRVANTDLSVLITGESGVGKEVFSKILHQLSARKHNPFIAVNCGAIPEGTIDSELFGHEKGSFTGAHDSRKGYFEQVNNGTIFLDEIGEMPIATQSRLLRVLESGEFMKVGSSKTIKTDVRVIAATNVNLWDAIQKGKFREDLFYRLNTVPINVPALKERKEDIPLLFRKFVVDFAERNHTEIIKLNPEAVNLLQSYPWPGNIRELKNLAEQLTILSPEKNISPEILKQFLPKENLNRLPAVYQSEYGNKNDFSERELLYKLFFDLKKDINDIKQYLFQFNNDSYLSDSDNKINKEEEYPSYIKDEVSKNDFKPSPIPLEDKRKEEYETEGTDTHETIDATLSIAEMEKDMIEKALKINKGKRKRAAEDLGISERTLYRKIKEYNLNNI